MGVVTPQIERSMLKKKKVVKMLVTLLIIFGVCWLPYHGYFIYKNIYPEVERMPSIQHVFLAFYWCAMTHSTVNPIVYYLMNKTFRKYFQQALTLSFLKRSGMRAENDAKSGINVATTLSIQVAAQLTYGGNELQDQDPDDSLLSWDDEFKKTRGGSNMANMESLDCNVIVNGELVARSRRGRRKSATIRIFSDKSNRSQQGPVSTIANSSKELTQRTIVYPPRCTRV